MYQLDFKGGGRWHW